MWNWALGDHRHSPISHHSKEGVWEHEFYLRYCCSQCTVIFPFPPPFSIGEELREDRQEGFGCTGRLAESSQDLSTGFTYLYHSVHSISLPFRTKITINCCEALVLNVSLDCFQKASQNFPSRGITAVDSTVTVIHMVFLFLSSLPHLSSCPWMKFIKSCTLHRMQTDTQLVKNILLFIWKFFYPQIKGSWYIA